MGPPFPGPFGFPTMVLPFPGPSGFPTMVPPTMVPFMVVPPMVATIKKRGRKKRGKIKQAGGHKREEQNRLLNSQTNHLINPERCPAHRRMPMLNKNPICF